MGSGGACMAIFAAAAEAFKKALSALSVENAHSRTQ
jgi:hypothetical protein